MTAEDILLALVRINLVIGATILLVLILRPLALRWLGAKAAYRLWLVVPVAAAASFLPARQEVLIQPPLSFTEAPAPAAPVEAAPVASEGPSAPAMQLPTLPSLPVLADVLLAVWLLGAVGLLVRSIMSTRRLAADPSVGPALVGVLRPRLVLPADFETRFDARERALILAHEEVHRVSGHTLVNALVELVRCLCWFNPLAQLAAIRVRTDQELACDAAVIAAHPGERRAYAEALLKTQIARAWLPLGCTWPSRTSQRLEERITMLNRPSPGRLAGLASAAAIAIFGAASGYAAWAQQPPVVVPPDAVWTPSAEAPAGLLTPLEVRRHDVFIELAQTASSCPGAARAACTPGSIDIVFFGTTNTEMWWWPDRGVDVWSDAFGSRKAVNFGSQGSRRESLLWRMQNGELDGYSAKIVVLQAYSHRDDVVTELGPVIEEIRARQPQAKILIFADFPRGQQSLESWRELAAESAAAAAPLVDDETVFYIDIGERFFLPDGSHNQEMWRFPPVSGLENVGMQASGFEVWAEELEPWLDRFVG